MQIRYFLIRYVWMTETSPHFSWFTVNRILNTHMYSVYSGLWTCHNWLEICLNCGRKYRTFFTCFRIQLCKFRNAECCVWKEILYPLMERLMPSCGFYPTFHQCARHIWYMDFMILSPSSKQPSERRNVLSVINDAKTMLFTRILTNIYFLSISHRNLVHFRLSVSSALFRHDPILPASSSVKSWINVREDVRRVLRGAEYSLQYFRQAHFRLVSDRLQHIVPQKIGT